MGCCSSFKVILTVNLGSRMDFRKRLPSIIYNASAAETGGSFCEFLQSRSCACHSSSLPSCIFSTMSASAATVGSWVTITTQQPSSWASRFNISTMFLLFSLSRLPVGSSARMIRLPEARARAIAVRYCSPPESICGSCFNISSVMPTDESFSLAVCSAVTLSRF